MKNDYNILLIKLDKFIRKYYKNRIIRGVLISVALYGAFFLFVAVSEYYSHFSTGVRTAVFYFVLALFLAIFIRMIIIPLLQFNRIGRLISHKQAAAIIARHFNHIRDRLHNTLELADQMHIESRSRELLLASIDQRIEDMQPIPFTNAVDLKENLRYLWYAAGVILVILVIYLWTPSVLKEGTIRMVNHNTYYAPIAPFSFTLLNDSLFIEKGGDYEVNVLVEGSYVPENVHIEFGGNTFLMKKLSNSRFGYNFRNINNSIDFLFTAEEYDSERFRLTVLPTPVIMDFSVEVSVPAYTGEKDMMLKNIGDISIPAGSAVTWKFRTIDIDALVLSFQDTVNLPAANDSLEYTARRTFYESCGYKITTSNRHFSGKDAMTYSVNVIPDIHPDIRVSMVHDTLQYSVFYYRGIINDDYGFRNLFFCYRPDNKDSLVKIPLQISHSQTSQEFYYMFDFATLPGKKETVEYFFEVWDNDAVNGSKSARSSTYEYLVPDKEELEKIEAEANTSIRSKIEESMKLSKDLRKDIDRMREDLINDNMTSWQKTRMMEQITEKQKTLEQLMEQLSNDYSRKNEMMNSFSEEEMEVLKKQQEMQELLENIMDDELKDLINRFNELMDEMDKDKLHEITRDMEMSYDDLSEQLDRNLELLKQMEIEKNIENTIDKLEELARDQKELSEQTDSRKTNEEEMKELLEKQKEQSDEFDKAMEKYKEIMDKNSELKNPMKLDDFQESKENIKNEFNEGTQNMQENKPKKASQSQQQNSQNLQQMAQQMQNMMQQNAAQQNAENMDDLRQIIDNLVTFSFSQEALMESSKNLRRNDPGYPEAIRTQGKLSDDFSVIEDSLKALGERTPQLNSTITKEILAIERNLSRAVTNMEARNNTTAARDQQYVMTSANNLALLLSEVLRAMQQQMAQQCQGNQQCQKNCSKPGLGQMRMQQQSVKSQLQQMIDQMKGNKDGKNGRFDEKALNRRLAETLAQQEIFRQSLSKLMNSNNFSPETAKKLNEINRMVEQNETDLANRNITPTTMKRQEMIITRLLEAENSEYQREIDKKRESREGKNEKFSNPEEIFEYKGMNAPFNELLNVTNIKLQKYYKLKYKEYLLKLNEYPE
ncbi:MAG: hypothetical protein KJ607_13220 [Bacteroidetes bacterium]|nr:hypothetical protein [Bacteroidota bacterium]